MAFGCSAADFDNDGDLDLYVLNYTANQFYRNNGDGTFTDITEQSGLGDPHWSSERALARLQQRRDCSTCTSCNYLEYDAGEVPQLLRRRGPPRPAQLSRPTRRAVSQQWRWDLH